MKKNIWKMQQKINGELIRLQMGVRSAQAQNDAVSDTADWIRSFPGKKGHKKQSRAEGETKYPAEPEDETSWNAGQEEELQCSAKTENEEDGAQAESGKPGAPDAKEAAKDSASGTEQKTPSERTPGDWPGRIKKAGDARQIKHAPDGHPRDRISADRCTVRELQQAVLWAEILGPPASQKRRKRRVKQRNGNQSNAD